MSQGPGQPNNQWSQFLARLSGKNTPANEQSTLPAALSPGVSQVNSRLFVYPTDPTLRYDNLDGSPTITTIDLINMTITGASGVAVPLAITDPLLKNNVNSIMIFVSDADTIIRTDDGGIFNDHKLYHVINFLHSKRITITPPSGKVPNKFDLAFVLSNEPIMPYSLDLELAHTKKTNTLNTLDAFQDIFCVHLGGYDQLTFALKENNVADIDYQVLVSENDTDYFVLPNLGFPVKITKNTFALFTTNIKWHFYKVQVKSDAAGVPGNATIEASPIR